MNNLIGNLYQKAFIDGVNEHYVMIVGDGLWWYPPDSLFEIFPVGANPENIGYKFVGKKYIPQTGDICKKRYSHYLRQVISVKPDKVNNTLNITTFINDDSHLGDLEETIYTWGYEKFINEFEYLQNHDKISYKTPLTEGTILSYNAKNTNLVVSVDDTEQTFDVVVLDCNGVDNPPEYLNPITYPQSKYYNEEDTFSYVQHMNDWPDEILCTNSEAHSTKCILPCESCTIDCGAPSHEALDKMYHNPNP